MCVKGKKVTIDLPGSTGWTKRYFSYKMICVYEGNYITQLSDQMRRCPGGKTRGDSLSKQRRAH